MRTTLSYAVIGALLLAPLRVAAADGDPAVRITADSLVHERANDTIRARGDVRIDWQGYSLLADEADYRQSIDTANAIGRVRLLRGDAELTSDSLYLNLATQQGEAVNARLKTGEGNLRVKGARLEKHGDDEYRLERGSFTTCDADPPSWEFTASDLDVTVEGYATGKNVVFSVAGVPLLYTPYILFPVKRERQSGFLFPRLGSSTKKGVSVDIPYYWAISPSSEAVFDLDIQTKRGVGAGIDAAYLGKSGSHGSGRLYAIYDTDLQRERVNLSGTAKQVVTPQIDFNADLTLATDRVFYRDFGEASGDYNRQSLDSSVSLTRRWESWYLAGETRFMNSLEDTDNSLTLQRLPELTLTGVGSRLGSLPLYAGLDSRFTNFYRRQGLIGQRFVLQPRLTWYADLPQGLALSAWGGYQQRFYQASGGQEEGAPSTGLALAGAMASASFDRVYDAGIGGFSRLKHLLEPSISYSFVQEKDQQGLPYFDYDDRVVGQNLIGWALTNSLIGRSEQPDGVEYRELLLARLSQGYQLSGGRRDLLNGADSGRSLTDLRLELRLQPYRNLLIEADGRLSPYRGDVTTAALTADLHDDRGNLVGIGYRRIEGTVDYLEGKLGLSLVKPLIFNYTSRYSLDRQGFLESFYSLEYRHQCWSVAFTYRDRPDNREFLISFSLAGIGNLGKVKTF